MKIIRWTGPAQRLGRRFFRYDEAVMDDDACRILRAQWFFHLDRKMLGRFPQYFAVGEISRYLEPFGIVIDGYNKPPRMPPPPRYRAGFNNQFDRPMTSVEETYIPNFIKYNGPREGSEDLFDIFYANRKPWKSVTQQFIEDLIRRDGGEVVQGS